MAEQGGAHVGFNFRTHDVTDVCHIIGACGVNDAQDKIQHAQADNQIRCQCGKIVLGEIHDVSHDDRKCQLANGGERGTEQVQNQRGNIRLKIRSKAAKQLSSGAGSSMCFFQNDFILSKNIKQT